MTNTRKILEELKNFLQKEILCSVEDHNKIITVIEDMGAEIEKLREALKLTARELKTCMTGYQKKTLYMPNYDITESTLWDMFNTALNTANEALKDGK